MKVTTQHKLLRFHPIVAIVNYNLIMALSKIELPSSICDQLRGLAMLYFEHHCAQNGDIDQC
jgi:hypothetical protein